MSGASRSSSRSGPKPAGRRSAAQMTRRRLLRAGRRAFARRGLAGVNLRDHILRPARVSVGSFYHQFEDKTDLLLAILREHGEEVRRRLEAEREGDPAVSLAELVARTYRAVLALATDHPELWRIGSRERASGDPRVRRLLRAERELWIRWLREEQRRLAAASGLRLDVERVSVYVLGLAGTLVEARLGEGRRGGDGGLDALVRFSVGGALALRAPSARRRGAARPARTARR